MRIKYIIDFVCAFIGLGLLGIPIIIAYIVTCIDTRSNGIFPQVRIGQFAKPFTIYKFKTINPNTGKISKIGRFLRKYKIDELPQLFNILKGDMSFVGPRPDLPGYYDTLTGEYALILNLRPGLTSRASIKYRNEEQLLARQRDPKTYNDKVIFPDKVRMNLDYYYHNSIKIDVQIVFDTFKSMFYV